MWRRLARKLMRVDKGGPGTSLMEISVALMLISLVAVALMLISLVAVGLIGSIAVGARAGSTIADQDISLIAAPFPGRVRRQQAGSRNLPAVSFGGSTPGRNW